jgi:hypothetical protein
MYAPIHVLANTAVESRPPRSPRGDTSFFVANGMVHARRWSAATAVGFGEAACGAAILDAPLAAAHQDSESLLRSLKNKLTFASDADTMDTGWSVFGPEHVSTSGPFAAPLASLALRPQPVATPESLLLQDWATYIAAMGCQTLSRQLESFWRRALAASGGKLRPPIALPQEDGSVHLAWDNGPLHLEVDLFQDGTIEWFYRNRKTNELDGTDDERASGLPEALAARLGAISNRGARP